MWGFYPKSATSAIESFNVIDCIIHDSFPFIYRITWPTLPSSNIGYPSLSGIKWAFILNKELNSLGYNDAIWRQKYVSTMARVMTISGTHIAPMSQRFSIYGNFLKIPFWEEFIFSITESYGANWKSRKPQDGFEVNIIYFHLKK